MVECNPYIEKFALNLSTGPMPGAEERRPSWKEVMGSDFPVVDQGKEAGPDFAEDSRASRCMVCSLP